MIVVAVVLGAFSAVRAVHIVWDAFDGPAIDAPGITTIHLGAGRWIIFERTGTEQDFGPVQTQTDRPTTIAPDNVEVTDTDGNEQSVRDVTGDQSITLGSTKFTGAVEFSVPADGTYVIVIQGTPATSALLARALSDQVKAAAPWLILLVAGGILLIFGVVFTVLPAGSSMAARRPVSPPGWYQDPSAPMRFRWWDGRTWTGHTAAWPPAGNRPP
jgi:hypothetical protein